MLFTGIYELTVDAKNRLSIPAAVRAGVDPRRHGKDFYLVPGDRQGTLCLYPSFYFEEYVERRYAALKRSERKRDFEAIFYSMATLLEVDGQGRVVLPQRWLSFVGFGREVTLTGARDHLSVWNRADYEVFMKSKWDEYPRLLDEAEQDTKAEKVDGDQG